jgi:hypothetical protein
MCSCLLWRVPLTSPTIARPPPPGRRRTVWSPVPEAARWFINPDLVPRAGAVVPGSSVASGSTAPLLFTLGLNRLGQGAVIAVRAMLAGIPFAPEKDGSTFGSGAFNGIGRDRSARY